jgi:hypothetical protein
MKSLIRELVQLSFEMSLIVFYGPGLLPGAFYRFRVAAVSAKGQVLDTLPLTLADPESRVLDPSRDATAGLVPGASIYHRSCP